MRCTASLSLILIILFSFSASAQERVEVSNTIVKVSVSEGEIVKRTITITSDVEGEFVLEVRGIRGVSVKSNYFILGQQRSKEVEIDFDSVGMAPGVYVGVIRVNGPIDNSDILVIFEVESEPLLLDANLEIPPVYTEIEQGSRLVFQTKIFDLTSAGGIPEGLGQITAETEFRVTGLDGSLLISRNEEILVNKQTQVSNTISFPEGVAPGVYVLSAIVSYGDSVGISSQVFTIYERRSGVTRLTQNSEYFLLAVIGSAVFIFFIVLLIFVYLIRDRDKMLIELKNYNAKEIKQVKKILFQQQAILRKRKMDNVNVRKEVQTKIQNLKKKQKNRINELSEMRKRGNLSEMKKKLEKWKSQGYETSALSYKISGLSKTEMEGILKNWKKKYSKKKNQRI